MKNQPFGFQQKLLEEIDVLQVSSNKPIVLAASCDACIQLKLEAEEKENRRNAEERANAEPTEE